MVQMPGPGSLKKPSAPLQIAQRRRPPRMRRCVYGPRYAVSSRGRLAFHASTGRLTDFLRCTHATRVRAARIHTSTTKPSTTRTGRQSFCGRGRRYRSTTGRHARAAGATPRARISGPCTKGPSGSEPCGKPNRARWRADSRRCACVCAHACERA
jgi:hypothetical protein